MRRRNGFTLIELLVVIAIIGILAAIIFPVYAQAKKSAYKSSDLSNMNSLRTALQLYKADTGSYPPALLGYVGPYENNSTSGRNISNGNVVPASAVRDALYPKRVESLTVFRPALDRVADNIPATPYNDAAITAGNNALVAPALWPASSAYGQGGTAAEPKQRFGPNDGYVTRANNLTVPCSIQTNYYYRLSGYDVAPVSNAPGAKLETHYQLFWSGWTVPTDPCFPNSATESGNASDTPRQLGYDDPPGDTVVTWNPFFRDYVNGAPQHAKQDLVLFLAGNARAMDSANLANQAWTVRP